MLLEWMELDERLDGPGPCAPEQMKALCTGVPEHQGDHIFAFNRFWTSTRHGDLPTTATETAHQRYPRQRAVSHGYFLWPENRPPHSPVCFCLEATVRKKQIRVASVVPVDTAVYFPQFLLDDSQGNLRLHGTTVAVIADRSKH